MTCPKLPVVGGFSEGSWNATWDVRPARWLHGRHSAWLLFGVCACFSSLNPAHSEAQTAGVVAVIDENSDNNALDDAISAADQASHGKKVYTDYSVTDRLQTGMRGAFGKPQGTCARVAIGQVLLSVRCKENHSNHAQEALHRAKFKFPGRQKIIISRKWGFTKFTRADYLKWKSESRIVPDGVNAKLLGCRGPLSNRKPGQAFLKPALVSSSNLVA